MPVAVLERPPAETTTAPSERGPVENRFQKVGDQFREIQTRFLATVAGLKRDNPNINLTAEEEDLRSQSNQLDSLGEETSGKLGIDVRGAVGAVGEKVRGGIDTLAGRAEIKLEAMRREDLLRHFQQEGLEDPQKALEVVEWLERHVISSGWQKVHGKERHIIVSYKYKEEDIQIVRQLTEDVADPVGLFKQLSEVMYLGRDIYYYHGLKDFSSYIELIKADPRLPDLFTKLKQLGPLRQPYLMGFLNERRMKIGFNKQPLDLNQDYQDSLLNLLRLPQEEYERLLSEDNISWMRDLRQKFFSEGEHVYEMDLALLPKLSTIASDQTLRAMYEGSIKNRGEVGNFNASDLDRSINRFLALTNTAPELAELYRRGFNIKDITRYKGYQVDPSFVKDLSEAMARRGEFQQVLADEQLCQKAQLLVRHGIDVFFGKDLEGFPNYQWKFYTEASPEVLEKTIALYKGLNLPEGLEPAKLYGFCQDRLSHASLEQVQQLAAVAKELSETVNFRIYNLLDENGFNFVNYFVQHPEAFERSRVFAKAYEGVDYSRLLMWLLERRNDSQFNLVDYIDESGIATPRFINLLGDSFSGGTASLDLLSDGAIEQMSGKDRVFWRFYKDHVSASNCSSPFFGYLITNRDHVADLIVDAKPTPALIEEVAGSDSASGLQHLLTDEIMATFPANARQFWDFFKDQSIDLQRFLVSKGSFPALYDLYLKDGVLDKQRIHKEFINEVLVSPERIGTWETLSGVFFQLQTVTDGEQRPLVFLRIAEALRNQQLIQRTEVEALANLRDIFATLYRPDMGGLEKLAWNLLRRELPFAIDDRLRQDMRNQALVVEQHDPGSLGWVHQTVHNYVRMPTPEYIRTFRRWLETGDEIQLTKLHELARDYPPEARAPGFTSAVRGSLQETAFEDVKKLEELVSGFYEVSPQKLRASLRDASFALEQRLPDLPGEVGELASVLEKAKQEEASDKVLAGRDYAMFLIKTPDIRKRILTTVQGGMAVSDHVLALDAVLSDLFRKSLPVYVDSVVRPKMKDGTLTFGDAAEFMEVFNATLKSSFLEGENQNLEQYLEVFGRLTTPESLNPASVHGARLNLALAQHQLNSEWGRFMSIAHPEMVAMLERMGVPHEEAVNRVYGTDLVEFRKNSYSFYLEDLMNTASDVLVKLEEEPKGLEKEEITTRYQQMTKGQTVETPSQVDEAVRAYIQQKASNIPIQGQDLTQLDRSLSQFFQSEDAQAERFLRELQPGYLNKETLTRETVTLQEGENTITFYPYSLYGIDAVVITVNGNVIPNPLTFVRQRYRGKIVPAMEHALRQGD